MVEHRQSTRLQVYPPQLSCKAVSCILHNIGRIKAFITSPIIDGLLIGYPSGHDEIGGAQRKIRGADLITMTSLSWFYCAKKRVCFLPGSRNKHFILDSY